jgi:hypothetical protein
VQDTILVIPPYPYCIETENDDVPLEDCWYARPQLDGRRGSNAYEVNPWLWQFGRGKPRLGGLSVEKTGAKKAAAQKERLLRGAETRRRRKADRE